MSPARSARVSTITQTDPIWAVVQILQHSSLSPLLEPLLPLSLDTVIDKAFKLYPPFLWPGHHIPHCVLHSSTGTCKGAALVRVFYLYYISRHLNKQTYHGQMLLYC